MEHDTGSAVSCSDWDGHWWEPVRVRYSPSSATVSEWSRWYCWVRWPALGLTESFDRVCLTKRRQQNESTHPHDGDCNAASGEPAVLDSNCQYNAGSTTMLSTTLESSPPRMTMAIGV